MTTHMMARHLTLAGDILREVLFALAALAMLLLAFAHQPVLASPAALPVASYVPVNTVYCGDGPADSHHSQGPCHACRVSAAALPPPPSDAEPAFFETLAVGYVVFEARFPQEDAVHRPHARGPPGLV
jgi:hypothetical protein